MDVRIQLNIQNRLIQTMTEDTSVKNTLNKIKLNSIRKLKDAGLWVIGTDGDADTLYYNQDLKGPLAIVIGFDLFLPLPIKLFPFQLTPTFSSNFRL